MSSLQHLCMDVLTSSMEWQQDFLLLKSVDSSIANRMFARLLPMFELKPQHLTFFAGAATDLCLNGVTMKGSPDCAEWCQYAMFWRGLRLLSLSNCPRLKDEHLATLKHAPGTLQHLTLDGCVRLTLSVVNLLPQDVSLRSLMFKNCGSSTCVLPERMASLTQLTLLNLAGHELTDRDIPTLTPLNSLKSLDISGSKISQDGIDQLCVLSALTHLDISWTLAHHPPPLSCLQVLCMDSCDLGGSWDITYAVHASMHGGSCQLFSQMHQLSLNSCRFEADDGSQEGTELLVFLTQAAAKSLHTLSLQGVRFSVSSYSALMQALPQSRALKSLYLEDIGTLPPASLTSLQELPALTKVQLRSGATTHDSHLAELANVKGLADLEITDADHLTDESLSSLLQKDIAASLTRLVLGSRRMRGHCDHIISFRPQDGEVRVDEDDPIVGWAHMPRLVHLQLTAADSDTVVTQACTACTALQSLVVTGGQVLPSSLAPAAALQSLTHLEFPGGLPCAELVDTLMLSTSLRTVVLRCWIPEAVATGSQSSVFWPPQQLKHILQRRGGDFVILGAKGVLGEEGAWGTDVPWLGPSEMGSSLPGQSSQVSTGGSSSASGTSRSGGARMSHPSTTEQRGDRGMLKGGLRLRYSKSTLLAMKSRPECNRSLRELGRGAVVPAELAKSAW